MGKEPYYGIVGNGETCCLLSPRGSIDWLCLPRFDGEIVYSKALDMQNGRSFAMRFFTGSKELKRLRTSQRYLPKTNVLVTELTFDGVRVLVHDFMPWGERALFRVASLEGTGKKLAVRITLHSDATNSSSTTLEKGVFYSKRAFLGLHLFTGTTIAVEKNKSATFAAAVVYGESSTEVARTLRRIAALDPVLELSRATEFWTNWTDRGITPVFKNALHEEVFYRSLLAMKLLQYKSGATVAAATASFPATPGRLENWDYRFAWVRDNYFACRAFLLSGHYEEAKKILSFLYSLQQKNGHWKLPLYRIDGSEPAEEVILEDLHGPHGEDSIRISNEAKNQLQLDSEGSVLTATYLYAMRTRDLAFVQKHWPHIQAAAQWVARNYSSEEHGIWEFRDRAGHYTYGKVLCVAALDAAVRLGQLLGKNVSRWKNKRDVISREVVKRAWSSHRKAFLQTYDGDAPVDISVLSLADFGLVHPKDRRMTTTVALIEKKLVTNNSVKRYENAFLPFYLPTLWLASYYLNVGDKRRASTLIETCIDSTTDLLLPAEHFDPATGTQHGNFPQAFCASVFVEVLLHYHTNEAPFGRILHLFNSNLSSAKKLLLFDKDALIRGSGGV